MHPGLLVLLHTGSQESSTTAYYTLRYCHLKAFADLIDADTLVDVFGCSRHGSAHQIKM